MYGTIHIGKNNGGGLIPARILNWATYVLNPYEHNTAWKFPEENFHMIFFSNESSFLFYGHT